MSKQISDQWLAWLLRLVGFSALFAFVAALMPAWCIVAITDELDLEPFPETPLAFYLARHLSLLYGFVGIALLYLASDLPRYRHLVGFIAIGTVAFGVLQGVIDFQSAMPTWWTVGESVSTVAGGLLIGWLHRTCE
ncbi:hypothetical protein FYK55_15450 [Roseiconus nitratireducens]|uniref:Uncharacterized protein n=1 Tax=Roseiconus nitratireducens TaxID=2605748 RepID=A0A5M6D8H7_9BACT|nr:hypothetical protein [Roseiconus nitratireducens]KAA5542199.1 hypothetical protein FYK55_15450 [Roseiconus nitratireducens]